MIEIPFLTTEAAFAALWILVRLAVWLRQKHIDRKREVLLLLMYVNLAVIIRLTFFPMSRAGGTVRPLVLDPAAVYPFRINVIPFINLFDYDSMRDLLLNVAGNIFLFIPTGILLPILYRKLNTFVKVTVTGVLLSLCFELLQLPFFDRVTDIDDLILNTVGVIIGYMICSGIKRTRR